VEQIVVRRLRKVNGPQRFKCHAAQNLRTKVIGSNGVFVNRGGSKDVESRAVRTIAYGAQLSAFEMTIIALSQAPLVRGLRELLCRSRRVPFETSLLTCVIAAD
jgi:hypothetical protein